MNGYPKRWSRMDGILAFASACLAVALFSGCQGGVNTPAPPSGEETSFSQDVQPIFSARCTSCHRPGSPTNTIVGIPMVLTAGAAYDAIVERPSSQRPDLTLVVPGDAQSSLLWLKVSSNNPPVGSTMPLIGPRLTSAELAVVRDWIDQGALDN